jgi:hypothetical protein
LRNSWKKCGSNSTVFPSYAPDCRWLLEPVSPQKKNSRQKKKEKWKRCDSPEQRFQCNSHFGSGGGGHFHNHD